LQTVTLNHRSGLWKVLEAFASDIKLTHSIFALPFVGVALTMTGFSGMSFLRFLQLLACMVLARSFAMGMNRYLDRHIDRENVRTKVRVLPSGKVNHKAYLFVTLLCGAGFVLVAASLSPLAGWLSPILLAVLAFYSLMKKISWLTHWYLGVCLGLAPIATELALFDRITTPIVLVGLAVTFWTAGFDILYSLQDREFDVSKGLHSVPAKLGHRLAIWLSRFSFVLMILCLMIAGRGINAGFWWSFGTWVVAGILGAEHWIIRDAMVTGKSDKINMAFFNLNALVSVLFFAFALVDFYGRS
jgi:4-hydroxybenzoate polyprenyltransferase